MHMFQFMKNWIQAPGIISQAKEIGRYLIYGSELRNLEQLDSVVRGMKKHVNEQDINPKEMQEILKKKERFIESQFMAMKETTKRSLYSKLKLEDLKQSLQSSDIYQMLESIPKKERETIFETISEEKLQSAIDEFEALGSLKDIIEDRKRKGAGKTPGSLIEEINETRKMMQRPENAQFANNLIFKSLDHMESQMIQLCRFDQSFEKVLINEETRKAYHSSASFQRVKGLVEMVSGSLAGIRNNLTVLNHELSKKREPTSSVISQAAFDELTLQKQEIVQESDRIEILKSISEEQRQGEGQAPVAAITETGDLEKQAEPPYQEFSKDEGIADRCSGQSDHEEEDDRNAFFSIVEIFDSILSDPNTNSSVRERYQGLTDHLRTSSKEQRQRILEVIVRYVPEEKRDPQNLMFLLGEIYVENRSKN